MLKFSGTHERVPVFRDYMPASDAMQGGNMACKMGTCMFFVAASQRHATALLLTFSSKSISLSITAFKTCSSKKQQ